MKKILYLVSTLSSSGPTNQLSYIISSLDRKIFDPYILTLSDEPILSSIDYFETYLKVPIESLGLSRVQSIFTGLSKVMNYVLDNEIDLIHSQGIRADGLIRKMSIPKVCTIRTYPYKDYLTKFGRLKGIFMAYSHMRIIKSNSKNYIACSKSISEEFYKHDIFIDFIQNGVDALKYFPLQIKDKLKLRKKLGLDLNKRIFITVGNLIPRKDMKTVIKGFNLFNKTNNSILLIAGEGFEMDNLKLISNDFVLFLGNVSNIVEYLQVSDFFVSASLSEGLPNTVLEAMACGLPVILSNIPSHRELSNQHHNFFEVHDFNELSKKMISLDINIIKVGETMNNKFTAEVMSKKYQRLYLKRIQ
jgi:glycosyltransferase involved in cell wall biosynthesis